MTAATQKTTGKITSVTWPEYMPRKLAAAYLGEVHGVYISAQQLARLAMTGTGPEYCKTSYRTVYHRLSLDNYARARRSPPAKSVAAHFIRDELNSGKPRATEARKYEGNDRGKSIA